MKKPTQNLLLAACAFGVLVLGAKLTAADNAATSSALDGNNHAVFTAIADTNTNGIPDLLKTCPVSGDKLGGDMGAPYVFSYKGQEVKLCCSGCKKDFDKNPDKYLKLIRAADKKK